MMPRICLAFERLAAASKGAAKPVGWPKRPVVQSSFMAMRAGVWTAGKLLLLTVALAGTYGVFAVAAARVALRAREVTVPNLRGSTLTAAGAALQDLDLSLRVEPNRRTDPLVPPGRIVSQDPPGGVVARRGRRVKVWLSAGPRSAVVPPLVNELERTALLKLTQDGISEVSVSEMRSNEQPAGVVVAQDPPGGTPGGGIRILVNRGDRAVTFVMPDLIGLDAGRAAEVLRAAGFRVTVVGEHLYPGVPPGFVLRQAPQAGFQISPGEPIAMEVSR